MSEILQVKGLREVQRQLYRYSQQLGDRVIYGALRQGANLVKREIEKTVPVRTGRLRRGFKVSRSRIHRGRLSDDMIGVYLTLRKGKGAPYYGRFINDGYQRGKTRVPGLHFVEAAFRAKKEDAVRLIVLSAQAGADVLAKKQGLA